jgi:hypothetical protein
LSRGTHLAYSGMNFTPFERHTATRKARSHLPTTRNTASVGPAARGARLTRRPLHAAPTHVPLARVRAPAPPPPLHCACLESPGAEPCAMCAPAGGEAGEGGHTTIPCHRAGPGAPDPRGTQPPPAAAWKLRRRTPIRRRAAVAWCLFHASAGLPALRRWPASPWTQPTFCYHCLRALSRARQPALQALLVPAPHTPVRAADGRRPRPGAWARRATRSAGGVVVPPSAPPTLYTPPVWWRRASRLGLLLVPRHPGALKDVQGEGRTGRAIAEPDVRPFPSPAFLV